MLVIHFLIESFWVVHIFLEVNRSSFAFSNFTAPYGPTLTNTEIPGGVVGSLFFLSA